MKNILSLLLLCQIINSSLVTAKSVEEARIETAQKSIPKTVDQFDHLSQFFANLWPKVESYDDAVTLVDFYGNSLWRVAKQHINSDDRFDDRGLYWQRLKLSRILRNSAPAFKLSNSEKNALLQRLEDTSRGVQDLDYRQGMHKRILLTGFDPFLLDRNIEQSNPSGVAAQMLDGLVIEHAGITAEINTVIVPVRYVDFDQGFIEKTLAPFYALNSVDMVVTVSMGREDFDLERFPGKRRSASAPGNLNIYSGGSKENSVISQLYNRPLPGLEFVEFSLPVAHMLKAEGKFKINDNHQVTTLEKTFQPSSLIELKDAIAVEGSGGGYLSNEISYRSIRLRNQLDSSIPTGHIHTPRIKQFEPETNRAIIEQIVKMLELALPTL